MPSAYVTPWFKGSALPSAAGRHQQALQSTGTEAAPRSMASGHQGAGMVW